MPRPSASSFCRWQKLARGVVFPPVNLRELLASFARAKLEAVGRPSLSCTCPLFRPPCFSAVKQTADEKVVLLRRPIFLSDIHELLANFALAKLEAGGRTSYHAGCFYLSCEKYWSCSLPEFAVGKLVAHPTSHFEFPHHNDRYAAIPSNSINYAHQNYTQKTAFTQIVVKTNVSPEQFRKWRYALSAGAETDYLIKKQP